MKTYEIKGTCENCGFAHQGTVAQDYIDSHEGGVVCPSCAEVTCNWDESFAVDRLDKEEGDIRTYAVSTYA